MENLLKNAEVDLQIDSGQNVALMKKTSLNCNNSFEIAVNKDNFEFYLLKVTLASAKIKFDATCKNSLKSKSIFIILQFLEVSMYIIAYRIPTFFLTSEPEVDYKQPVESDRCRKGFIILNQPVFVIKLDNDYIKDVVSITLRYRKSEVSNIVLLL